MVSVAFSPLSGRLGSALLGTASPDRFTDPLREDRPKLDRRERIHGPADRSHTDTLTYTIVIIIVSAIIFVTVVAIYDVVKTMIANYYARRSLTDPRSHNKDEDIERTLISNEEELKSAVLFAALVLISALLLVPVLLAMIPTPE